MVYKKAKLYHSGYNMCCNSIYVVKKCGHNIWHNIKKKTGNTICHYSKKAGIHGKNMHQQ